MLVDLGTLWAHHWTVTWIVKSSSMTSSLPIRQAVISAAEGEGIYCPRISCSRAGSMDVNKISDQKGKIFRRKWSVGLQKGILLLWFHGEERRESHRSHEKSKREILTGNEWLVALTTILTGSEKNKRTYWVHLLRQSLYNAHLAGRMENGSNPGSSRTTLGLQTHDYMPMKNTVN